MGMNKIDVVDLKAAAAINAKKVTAAIGQAL
jgi:hypothetical protein